MTFEEHQIMPPFGVWTIYKHAKTGKLLGPCKAPRTPAYVVLASIEDDEWRELTADQSVAYAEALVSTIH